MYFCKINLRVFFFQSAFSQTSSSTSSKPHASLQASYLDEEICIDSIQISEYWDRCLMDLYLMCKLRLVIIEATASSYLMLHGSLFIKRRDIERLLYYSQQFHHHRFKI